MLDVKFEAMYKLSRRDYCSDLLELSAPTSAKVKRVVLSAPYCHPAF